MKRIRTPLSASDVQHLQAGDKLLIDGVIYTGRDAAHKRLVQLLDKGEDLPIDIEGQIIYYVGPCPARPGEIIGPAGPTTSGRMDPYSPKLIARGLRGMIGKGLRSDEVVEAMKKYGAVYLVTVGGAAALVAERIKKAEVVAFSDLGTEAIYRLEVEDFPAIVVIDSQGGNFYEEGKNRYREL